MDKQKCKNCKQPYGRFGKHGLLHHIKVAEKCSKVYSKEEIAELGQLKENENIKIQKQNYDTDCKGCSKHFQNGILRHISHSGKCESFYSKEELSELQDIAAAKINARKRETRASKGTQNNQNKRDYSALGKTQLLTKANMQMIKCIGCEYKFSQESILKHITKSIKCKNLYNSSAIGPEFNKIVKLSESRSQTKEKDRSKRHYQNNKAKISEKYSLDMLLKKQLDNNSTTSDNECKSCEINFEDNSILKHISQSKKCKNLYSLPSLKQDFERLNQRSQFAIKQNRVNRYRQDKEDEKLRKLDEFEERRRQELPNQCKYVEERARSSNEMSFKWLKKCFKDLFDNFKRIDKESRETIQSFEQKIEEKYKDFDVKIDQMLEIAKEFDNMHKIYDFFEEYTAGRVTHTYMLPLKRQNKIQLEWHDLKQKIDVQLGTLLKKKGKNFPGAPWHGVLCNLCKIYRDWKTGEPYFPPRYSFEQDPDMKV